MPKRRNKTNQTSVRFDDPLWQRLEAFVEESRRDRSAVIVRAVEEYLDRHEKPAKAAPAK